MKRPKNLRLIDNVYISRWDDWIECRVCTYQFRKENMWKITETNDKYEEEVYYVCPECAPTKDEIDVRLNQLKKRKQKKQELLKKKERILWLENHGGYLKQFFSELW